MPRSTLKIIKFKTVEQATKSLLEALGFDLKHQDLKGTPTRVAKVFVKELSKEDPKVLKKLFSTFRLQSDVMIVLRGHKTFSRCPHHLERVLLKVDVGYISNEKVIGVSKLARIVDYFSKGLMLQEEIVTGVAEGLMKALSPKGVAVVAEGQHLCMMARGVESDGHVVTSKMTGVFLEDSHVGVAAREEFFNLVGRRV